MATHIRVSRRIFCSGGGGIKSDWGGVAVRAAGAGFLGEWPVSGGRETPCSKHTTTLFALCDHDILSREWRVVVDQVQTNYHGRPNGTIIGQVWPSCWLWGIFLMVECVLSQLRGTGMIASSSTFCPHPGRVIRDLFRLLDAVYGIVRKH